MKDLTRIEPEPEVNNETATDLIEWLNRSKGHGLYEEQAVEIIRLLIHKVNELTDELNRIKASNK